MSEQQPDESSSRQDKTVPNHYTSDEISQMSIWDFLTFKTTFKLNKESWMEYYTRRRDEMGAMLGMIAMRLAVIFGCMFAFFYIVFSIIKFFK